MLLSCVVACASGPPSRRDRPSQILTRAKPVEWSTIVASCAGTSGFPENPPHFENAEEALAQCEGGPSPCDCVANDLMCGMRCKSTAEQAHAACAIACEKAKLEGCTAFADAIASDDADCAKWLRYRAKDLRGEVRYEYVRVVYPEPL